MSQFSTRGIILFLASGFGVGHLAGPKGTYGSLLGIGYYFLLRQMGRPINYIGLTALGILATVWIAGHAEKILCRKDPQEIVLDEISCFPVAMSGSEIVLGQFTANGAFTNRPLLFFGNLAVVFVVYRILDIFKPSFLGRAEHLPGGWGIVLDDLLAGICTAVISIALLLSWFWVRNLSV